MKQITNLNGTVTDADCSTHPIRQSQRAGVHFETPDKVFRFLGVFDKELHLHHGCDIVSIPLDELWKLAEIAEPKFTQKPAKPAASLPAPKLSVPPGMKEVGVEPTKLPT